MKKQLMIAALAGLLAGPWLSSCNSGSSEKKVEDAQQDVAKAEQNLDDAEQRYAEEWDNFEKENEARISNNESDLIAYREREKTDKEFSRKYRETIDKLEAKNAEMKVKMHESKDKAKDRWEEFKREWNHDMDELGTSIRDLGRDNKN